MRLRHLEEAQEPEQEEEAKETAQELTSEPINTGERTGDGSLSHRQSTQETRLQHEDPMQLLTPPRGGPRGGAATGNIRGHNR